jgi:hypothetical protein
MGSDAAAEQRTAERGSALPSANAEAIRVVRQRVPAVAFVNNHFAGYALRRYGNSWRCPGERLARGGEPRAFALMGRGNAAA